MSVKVSVNLNKTEPRGRQSRAGEFLYKFHIIVAKLFARDLIRTVQTAHIKTNICAQNRDEADLERIYKDSN